MRGWRGWHSSTRTCERTSALCPDDCSSLSASLDLSLRAVVVAESAGPTSSAETRVILIEGDLSFGSLLIGESAERPFRIRNTGTAPLTVTGLTGLAGGFVASWTNGTIASNGAQDVTLRFSPTENRSYSGALTVTANHTGDKNTIPINARGLRPLFTRSGVGNTVFDMPTDVTRALITGTCQVAAKTSSFVSEAGSS